LDGSHHHGDETQNKDQIVPHTTLSG
jgi:hypothetical protein